MNVDGRLGDLSSGLGPRSDSVRPTEEMYPGRIEGFVDVTLRRQRRTGGMGVEDANEAPSARFCMPERSAMTDGIDHELSI